ncbi:MAG: hypothetical protein MUC43_19695 [Pirellula sp.]|nr:hypothetical protein [Pirellula sp.]
MTAFDLNWEIAKSLSNKRSEKTPSDDASRTLGKLPTQYLLVFLYLAIIAMVAAYDIYLTFQYQKTLYEMELNPIGRWIMGLDNLKIPGVYPVTFLVSRWGRIGHGVGIGVSAFQLGLAAFLTFA